MNIINIIILINKNVYLLYIILFTNYIINIIILINKNVYFQISIIFKM